VDGSDHRGIEFDSGASQDREERLAECVEGRLRLPDVEDLNLSVGFESDVVEASVRFALATAVRGRCG
jgi:hypothetical protein